MARTNPVVGNFCLRYVAEFETVVRWYHVYKIIWSAVIGEALFTKHDDREEAQNYDPRAKKLLARR